MKIENFIPEFLEKIQKDHKAIRLFKLSAINCQSYELAAHIREIEKELFPESEEAKQAKQDGTDILNVLGMVKINVQDKKIAWLIKKTIKCHSKKKGKFSLKDAADLQTKAEKLFENSEELK
jgi:hypothetical protein